VRSRVIGSWAAIRPGGRRRLWLRGLLERAGGDVLCGGQRQHVQAARAAAAALQEGMQRPEGARVDQAHHRDLGVAHNRPQCSDSFTRISSNSTQAHLWQSDSSGKGQTQSLIQLKPAPFDVAG
jgi:hypothetical protein